MTVRLFRGALQVMFAVAAKCSWGSSFMPEWTESFSFQHCWHWCFAALLLCSSSRRMELVAWQEVDVPALHSGIWSLAQCVPSCSVDPGRA